MKLAWDDNGAWTQALVLAYHQTRRHDEDERAAKMLGA